MSFSTFSFVSVKSLALYQFSWKVTSLLSFFKVATRCASKTTVAERQHTIFHGGRRRSVGLGQVSLYRFRHSHESLVALAFLSGFL